ncbi:hypothetical protein [Bradyrhizobium sp. ORS 111]|uniref:hypothetical protein n=1 Tax=Bradyrhizobium sp. ORS 111 TaxID=1685958 RepID=UPI00388E6B40
MSTYLRSQIDAMAPNDANLIAKAYEQTLRMLSVKDGDDPLTELIAKAVILSRSILSRSRKPVLIATRPPGRSTRRISAKARSGSGTWRTP